MKGNDYLFSMEVKVTIPLVIGRVSKEDIRNGAGLQFVDTVEMGVEKRTRNMKVFIGWEFVKEFMKRGAKFESGRRKNI